MAEKMVFFASDNAAYDEKIIEYDFYPGFAPSQKQKSMRSLHESIVRAFPGKSVLEISTKSDKQEGIMLSAFNLPFYHEEIQDRRHLENVFQSSKVFENGGPYRGLLNVAPKDAKKDPRLTESGFLKHFNLYGVDWPLEPKTLFYDWIYITALKQNQDLAVELMKYDVFTDIEFNHKKSINCQARSAAIFVSLSRQGVLEEKTKSKDAFMTIYATEQGSEQLTFL